MISAPKIDASFPTGNYCRGQWDSSLNKLQFSWRGCYVIRWEKYSFQTNTFGLKSYGRAFYEDKRTKF